MNGRIKIGYQGVQGSYSQTAARELAKKMGLKGVEYVGLITSRSVVENLKMGRVDYGVLAVKNNLAGDVAESQKALAGFDYCVEGEHLLSIRHCLCFYDKLTRREDVKEITSHEQALKQCRSYIEKNFPNVKTTNALDTALSAQQLKSGQLGEKVAVVCSKEAALRYNLWIEEENIAEEKSETKFIIISKLNKK